jgi:hypothetical protein
VSIINTELIFDEQKDVIDTQLLLRKVSFKKTTALSTEVASLSENILI